MNHLASASPPIERRSSRHTSWMNRLVSIACDPAYAIATVAVITTCFLVLYPAFWLFYGGFVYGHGGLSQAFSEFRHLPGLGRAFQNTLVITIATVPISFLIAMPLGWITSR